MALGSCPSAQGCRSPAGFSRRPPTSRHKKKSLENLVGSFSLVSLLMAKGIASFLFSLSSGASRAE